MFYKGDFKDNEELVTALRKGEERAYLHLLSTYHRPLFAYAVSLINDRALAQDIVQNVFLRTWQFRKKLNPDFAIKSFLYKSVYNEFVNAYKKNKTVTLLEKKYIETLSDTAESMDETRFERILEIVIVEIRNLPPKCQKVFTLSKQDGLTNREISEYLDISVKTVEAQITKAFGILRKKLGDKVESYLFLVFGNGEVR